MNERSHSIDFLFIIGLFILFALCALTVVMIGSKVYSSTVDTMESAHDNNTAMNYILEKVSLHNNGHVQVIRDGQKDVLCLTDGSHKDYLYAKHHHLYEYQSDQAFTAQNGQQILTIDSLHFSISHHLLTIRLSVNGHKQTSYMHLVRGD